MQAVKTYETVNRQDSELSFGISKMEEIYAKHQGQVDEPHRHDFYTMLIVEQAKGVHKIDFQTYSLSGQEVFFIAPGQVHQLIEQEASKGFSIVFSIDFLLQNHIPLDFINDLNLFREFGASPPLALSKEVFERLKVKAEEIYTLFHSDELLRLESIGALLKLILISCRQNCELENALREENHKKYELLRKFKGLVESHHKEWHQSKAYAEAMHLSVDHLNRIVKELSGKTLKTHIQSRIIVAAKRLLYFSNLSLKEIAFELGFDELSNFSAFFKKCTAQTPSQFRQQP